MEISSGFGIELFLIDGNVEGMRTAKIFNWTGRILVFPRTKILAALQRDESSHTGIYILLGEKDDVLQAYVGKSDKVSGRFEVHLKDPKKDLWTIAVLVTAADNQLDAHHIKYLESRLFEEGKKADNIKFENIQKPGKGDISEFSKASMETFIKQLLMVLPVLQVDVFVNKIKTSAVGSDELVFELTSIAGGIKATAVLENGYFVVQKGSLARGEYISKNTNNSNRDLYDNLVQKGVLVNKGENKVFDKSYAFSSSSAAAGVCKGRGASGPKNWIVVGTGQTLKDWETKGVAKNDE